MRSVANFHADPSARGASAAVASDGSLFLSDGSEILAIAPRSLAVKNRIRIAGVPTGLAVSPDGKRLFVSTDNRLIALDPSNGMKLAEIGTAGAQSIQFVISP